MFYSGCYSHFLFSKHQRTRTLFASSKCLFVMFVWHHCFSVDVYFCGYVLSIMCSAFNFPLSFRTNDTAKVLTKLYNSLFPFGIVWMNSASKNNIPRVQRQKMSAIWSSECSMLCDYRCIFSSYQKWSSHGKPLNKTNFELWYRSCMPAQRQFIITKNNEFYFNRTWPIWHFSCITRISSNILVIYSQTFVCTGISHGAYLSTNSE